MKVVNIFHALFICNVREVRHNKTRVTLAVSRAPVQLALPLLVMAILLFYHPWVLLKGRCIKCLDWFTVISRVLTTLAIVVLLVFDSFRRRLQLLALLTDLSTASTTVQTRGLLSVRGLQLGVLFVCNVLAFVDIVDTVYRTGSFALIPGVLTGFVVEHYILLHALFCQLLAESMAHAYDNLRREIASQPNWHGTLQDMLALEQCLQQHSEVFGFKLLLLFLHLLLNISFCAYDIARKLIGEDPRSGVYHLSIIVSQGSAALFGLCFYYNQLLVKVSSYGK
ncbi:hypothetical protein ZHAS_00016694 [Anopheles sinensis]|uniref:Gustatory receptor n=1 Tax=Anopheles sinensis TaxID=74873 RepID=A0A084WEQ0_ANOSI|nr:hypothetical protein ZHAS_00016694 [Anopheles sinensis]